MTFFPAIIALGGNMGDVSAMMAAALRSFDVRSDLRVVGVSRLYSTPPWGKTDQPDFINACAKVSTSLGPIDLLDLCLETERRHGRERGERWGPRTLDLDVVDYDGRTITNERLELPHPRARERAFVLRPLADLDPDGWLGDGTVKQHLGAVTDDGITAMTEDGDWWKA